MNLNLDEKCTFIGILVFTFDITPYYCIRSWERLPRQGSLNIVFYLAKQSKKIYNVCRTLSHDRTLGPRRTPRKFYMKFSRLSVFRRPPNICENVPIRKIFPHLKTKAPKYGGFLKTKFWTLPLKQSHLSQYVWVHNKINNHDQN